MEATEEMKEPEVSFVIPVRKPHLEFFRQALSSALNQTLRNLEVIIVMDGKWDSYDETKRLVENYHDERIRIIGSNYHIGLSRTLNLGIATARGEYIARLDCDDISAFNRIEEQISAMRKERAHLCGSFAFAVNENQEASGVIAEPTTPSQIRKWALLMTPFLHPTVVARREVLLNNPYDPEFVQSQDYELWLRLLSKGFRGINVPKPLVAIRYLTGMSLTRRSWITNRRYLLASKTRAVRKYGYTRPLDLAIFFGTWTMFGLHPRFVLPFKRLISRFESVRSTFERDNVHNTDTGPKARNE